MVLDTLPVPLVLVEGFLSATSAIFWGEFEQFLNSSSKGENFRRIIFTSVGPVSSLHDRACELFYELKGGRVDYGESHARMHDHERYGRRHRTGLYPMWSTERPLHFLGHSMGGPTITKLISLMREGFFGEAVHPNMVLSVMSVSAPFRGTQVVYTLGEKVDSAPAVRPLSVGSLISRMVHILAYLAPLLPPLPIDLHADARRLTCQQSTFSSFLSQMHRSAWAEGRDAAPYDCTFLAADEREMKGEGAPNPGTWYRSHVCILTQPRPTDLGHPGHHVPSGSSLISPFYFPALLVGSFDFLALNPLPSWLCMHIERSCSGIARDPLDIAECGGQLGDLNTRNERDRYLQAPLGEEYWANDGIVPMFSQWHPLPCSPSHCIHIEAKIDVNTNPPSPVPGVWHVHHQSGAAHHVALVPLWLGTQRQREFWTNVGAWLEQVEDAWRQREMKNIELNSEL